MSSVKRVHLSELLCGIISLRHSFVDVTDSIWVAVREKVLYPSVHVAMYSSISHIYEETLPPYFVICLFQINKDGNRVFVHLESIVNILCESDQLVFCGRPYSYF